MVSVSECLSVSLSAGIIQKHNVQMIPNFLYILPVAVARCSSNDKVIRYHYCTVFSVLWTTSFFSHNGVTGPQSRSCFIQFARCRHHSNVRQLYLRSSSPDSGTSFYSRSPCYVCRYNDQLRRPVEGDVSTCLASCYDCDR